MTFERKTAQLGSASGGSRDPLGDLDEGAAQGSAEPGPLLDARLGLGQEPVAVRYFVGSLVDPHPDDLERHFRMELDAPGSVAEPEGL